MANFAELINGTPQMMGPGAGSGKVGQVVQPAGSQTGLDHTPPKSPEEMQQRVGAWQGFLERIKTDPVLQNAMLMAGSQMVAGPQFLGENTGGIVGRAMQTGALSHMMGRANEAKAALAQREENRANATAQAQIGSLEAGAEERRNKTTEDKETLPLRKKRMDLETQGAEQDLTNRPRLFDSQMATAKSLQNRNNAQAAKAARPAGSGSPSTTSELSRLYEIANPDSTPQDIAKLVLEHNKRVEKTGGTTDTAKLTTLRSLFENTDGDERAMYKDLIHQSLGLDVKGKDAEAPKFKDPDGFRKAWAKTKEGAVFDFEGKRYKKETPK